MIWRSKTRAVLGTLVSTAILISIYSLIEFVSRPGVTPSPVLLEIVRHFFTGIPLVAAVVITLLLGATIASPERMSGPLKILQGVTAAIYFFVILGGGMLIFNFASSQVEARLTVGLFISLVFLEASSIFRAFQGILELVRPVRAH